MKTVTAQTHNGIARLIMNSPETGNLLTDDMVTAMITALDDFATQEDLKLVYLTATGPDFCTGIDLSVQSSADVFTEASRVKQMSRLFDTLYNHPLPVLATVKGRVVGDGVGLLCCCSMVLAGSSATFRLSSCSGDKFPALSLPYLVKVLGERNTLFYLLAGGKLTQKDALNCGLLQHCHPDAGLDQAAAGIMETIEGMNSEQVRQLRSLNQYCANEGYDESMVDISQEYLITYRRMLSDFTATEAE